MEEEKKEVPVQPKNELAGDNLESENIIVPKKNDTKDYHKKVFFFGVLLFSIILSSFFGAFFGFLGGTLGKEAYSGKLADIIRFSPKEQGKEVQNETIQKIIQEDSAVIEVVDSSTPAVVSIVITKDIPRMRSFFNDPFDFPEFFFGDPFGSGETQENGRDNSNRQTIGGGTGFFITSDGMIVTNKHVVSDTSADYTVMTNDGKEYPARVLARDSVLDIAVMKIEGENFPVLNFGNSDSLKIGQTVVAIGNSLGEFSNTVSRGIISGLKRNVTAGSGFGETEKLTNIIQTDAAINPGNSGGPLLDISGTVIGVNVAMAQGAQNIGFAIPSNQIERIVEQVKATGKISMPFLGVRYIPIDKTIQEENNLPFEYGILVARGNRVTDFAVIPGSPADKAGIVENDIILEVNGAKLDEKNPFADFIANKKAGEEVTLKIWHRGETKEIKVKLEERK